MNPLISEFKDEPSLVIMGPYDPKEMGAVTIFQDHGCQGKSSRFYWNPDDIDGGQYHSADSEKAGLDQNSASSIMVPRGYTAIMYGGKGFNDEIKRFEGRYLNDNT